MDILVGTLLAIVALEAVAIAGLILQSSRERGRLISNAEKERANLLDRLMSQNWGSYISGTRTSNTPEPTQLTTDEIEAAWYEAKERELAAADSGHNVGVEAA